ncbi:MAG: TIR domain-containing protein, partial [Anaerolineae bacterium]|nr:TIR domain-containing protein [Anaerolineae bacterium]
ISYSRRDKVFVQKLVERLKLDKGDLWIDWDDIPPASDWRDYIKVGIQETDAFIFVVSPDSVRSNECRIEIEAAVANNKRFVPILYRPVTESDDLAKMHSAINSHNWIFIRAEDDFEAGYQKLLGALNDDLAHIREHTRLQVRALAWDTGNRETSLLLRGRELAQAETWQAQASGKKPGRTPLQAEYIAASRQAETGRQRQLLLGVSIALAVAVGLALLSFALFQTSQVNLSLAETRGTAVAQQAATSTVAQGEAEFQRGTAVANEAIAEANAATATVAQGEAEFQRGTAVANELRAEANAATAVYQGGLAQSRSLASSARLQAELGKSELSALLALEALQTYPYTVEAEYALSAAVQSYIPGYKRPLAVSPSEGIIPAPAISPDGELLALPIARDQLAILELATGEAVQTLPTDNMWITDVAWAPGGKWLAVALSSLEVVVYSTVDWDEYYRIEGFRVSWSPDEATLLTWTVGEDGLPIYALWDAVDGSLLFILDALPFNSFATPFAWSPDSTQVVVGVQNRAEVYDVASGELVLTIGDFLSNVGALAWSPDGTLIAGGGIILTEDAVADFRITVWNAETGEELWTNRQAVNELYQVLWSPYGDQVMAVGADPTPRVYDAITGDLTLSLSGWRAAWSPDGEYIVTGGQTSGLATVWDTFTNGEVRLLQGHTSPVHAVSWSPDGHYIVTGAFEGTTRVWDWSRDSDLLFNTIGYGQNWIDNQHFYSINDDFLTSTIWSLDPEESVETRVPYYVMGMSSTGRAVVNIDGALAVLDEAYELPVLTYTEHQMGLYEAHWSPDGREIASVDAAGVLKVWNADTGETRLTLSGHSVAWSGDGSRLIGIEVFQEDDLVRLRVWEAATGEEVWSHETSWSSFTTLATISPDGRRVSFGLITGALEDMRVDVWDVERNVILQTLSGIGAVWSPDGQRMAVIRSDFSAAVVDSASAETLYTFGQVPVSRVAWSPDGNSLMTDDGSALITVWRAWPSTAALVEEARECCATRELTDDERAEFGVE